MKKTLTAMICSFPLLSYAFPCYVTLVKDSCWKDYAVSVNVIDELSGTTISTLNIAKDKNYARETFVCEPKQSLIFKAKFNPVFWEGDQDKSYISITSRVMPETLPTEETAWNIPLCFAKDFAEVPLPPKTDGKCICDMNSVPALKLP